jgi:hypothetical protein
VDIAMTVRTARLALALTIVVAYSLLDFAFMLIRFPPGATAAVPVAEILILCFLITIPADTNLLGPFFRTVPFVPLTIWWLVGVTQLCLSVPQYGFWAMRDATSLIESLFLWIGFVVAAVPGAIRIIVLWFNRILTLSVVIALTYPFRDLLAVISPIIMTTNNLPTQLFFSYENPPALSLVAALRMFVADFRYRGISSVWFSAALLVFVAGLFQQRRLYIQILFIMGYIAITRRGNPLRLLAPFAAAGILFLALISLGVPIPGRLTHEVSLDYYIQHIGAITGEASTTEGHHTVASAAGGVPQRLFWWEAIWSKVTSSWTNLFFGLGYGFNLVALSGDSEIAPYVREPHNSLISAFGRTGIVGLGAYIWLQVSLAIVAIRTYWAYRARGFEQIPQMIYLLGAMFSILWISAMVEDAFEKPFTTVPYYFFYGVILNLAHRLATTPLGRPASNNVSAT